MDSLSVEAAEEAARLLWQRVGGVAAGAEIATWFRADV